MSERPIRVMIVDDHPMIRRGLRTFLTGRSDLLCVGEAGDGQEAAERVAALAPDVLLLDVQMPRVGGIEAVDLIRARAPGVQIVILTSYQNQAVAAQAIRLGASAFLLKDVAEEDLVATIRLVHAGHRLLPPGADLTLQPADGESSSLPGAAPAAGALIAAGASGVAGASGASGAADAATPLPAPEHDLSPRELEILTLVVAGLSNKEIAHRLSLSLSTVKFHLSSVLAKLDVSTRTEATVVAMQRRLVAHPE